jgi:hypothetical protein
MRKDVRKEQKYIVLHTKWNMKKEKGRKKRDAIAKARSAESLFV